MTEVSKEPILEAESLHKTFHVGSQAISPLVGVNLAIRNGEFIAVIGTSGSGKSTLLHLLGGLDWPDSGRVTIEGKDLSTLSENELTLFRRARTGFIFQYFNLLPTLDVYENVALPFIIDGRSKKEDRDRIDDMIELFGLRGREKRSITELAGGEQQRVAIARAFLTEPAIVIADEPTGSLDSITGTEILQLLWESCDNFGQTILLVTHDPRVAVFADRVLFLHDGVLVEELDLGRREDHTDAGPVIRRLEDLGI